MLDESETVGREYLRLLAGRGMGSQLFHQDNDAFYDLVGLRKRAAEFVAGSSLICRAKSGDREAAVALKTSFWPFVQEFELAIDQQPLPREPLALKFGDAAMRRVFVGMARAIREMKSEEGSHAAHWRKDAECLGISFFADDRMPGVQELIDRAYTRDISLFFSMLAGTEFIAEELSRFLVDSQDFTGLFSRKRWMWGEIHLARHDDGGSHLEIDLDLARAYGSEDASRIEADVVSAMALFRKAADEIADAALLLA